MYSGNDAMKLYMTQIGQYPLVTPEQEIELAARIKKGSRKAQQKLVRSNLRLVVKIAHDFKGRGLPLVDLISEGNIGLCRAVEKFDPSKGAKLSSYAAWWIKQSMRRALANQARTVRIPIQSAAKISKLRAAAEELRSTQNRDPSDAELAEATGLGARTVRVLRGVSTTTVSLDAPVSADGERVYQELIPDESAERPDEVLGNAQLLSRAVSLITHLDDREQTILRMRFGLDGGRRHTLEEVSRVIGRTRERIRQIQQQALLKLRDMLIGDTCEHAQVPA